MDQRWSIDERTGCWVWLLYLTPRGYGRLTDKGRCGVLAHRWSYETHVGPIPPGMTVDHLCFNPACVNPDHLQLLTHLENAQRQRSALKTHCKNGHEFTPENTYIRPSRHRGGKRTCRACNAISAANYKARKAA